MSENAFAEKVERLKSELPAFDAVIADRQTALDEAKDGKRNHEARIRDAENDLAEYRQAHPEQGD